MEKERFSLLLLDPGEIYFEDFSAYLFPVETTENYIDNKKQIGHLKMCSKSIVFDPKDIMTPIFKIPLKDCSQINKWDCPVTSKFSSQNVIAIECNQYVEMLEGNILAPYTFKITKRKFLFLLNYAKLADCLPQISQLHRASTLPAAEQASMIAAIVYSRQSRVTFDTMWLDDLYEKVILETQGNKITPLVVNPGRILLTSSRLYFQPFNNVEPNPVLKIRLQDIRNVVKRRFLLQQVGLEVYCEKKSQMEHMYLTLETTKERDSLYDGLLSQPTLRLDNADQRSMTLQWQNGVLSNYDYLLYLNSLADRTFNDLTQYPVVPWVVADYTSEKLDLDDPKTFRNLCKPIGALDDTRLKRLKERYDEMSPPKFLYGSHYSTPGFVLFYLVRKCPHYMLCLQNGRFDHPDRMFNSISDAWNNVMKNMSDFKELVPEFYDTEQNGDFCVNNKAINFGHRHNGSKVDNVRLPPWANGPSDFVKKLREALESEYVSKNLHHWIDLIFGYKQTGTEADGAHNVFYYLCYEGAVDLGTIKDASQRYALEVQIMEFGQIPKQTFTLPHPQRRIESVKRSLTQPEYGSTGDAVGSTSSNKTLSRIAQKLRSNVSFQSHKESVTSVAISKSKQFVISVGQDSLLKMYTMSDKCQVRSVSLSSMALSSCIILSDDKTLLIGAWDNNITLYNLEFGRVIDSIRSHEDAVSCLAWGSKTRTLVSGSWDCSVRVWRGLDDGKRIKVSSSLVVELDHESRVSCLALNSDEKLLVSGTEDGELFIWSMESNSLKQKLPGHTARINAASFSPDGNKLISCGSDCDFQVVDLSTGMRVYCKTLDEELRCLSWDGFTLILGGSQGSLYIWDLVRVEMIQKIQAHNGPVLTIAVSEDWMLVATGGEDHRVIIWEPDFGSHPQL